MKKIQIHQYQNDEGTTLCAVEGTTIRVSGFHFSPAEARDLAEALILAAQDMESAT